MLYRCQSTVLDLCRVVSVDEVGSSRVFHIHMSGASHICFGAADKSRIALEALETDRKRLLETWSAYRNTRPRGAGMVRQLEGFHINLLAVSAISDVARRSYTFVGGYGPPKYRWQFDVHVMGIDRPIESTAPEEDDVALTTLRRSHDALLDAWQALHHQEAA